MCPRPSRMGLSAKPGQSAVSLTEGGGCCARAGSTNTRHNARVPSPPRMTRGREPITTALHRRVDGVVGRGEGLVDGTPSMCHTDQCYDRFASLVTRPRRIKLRYKSEASRDADGVQQIIQRMTRN